MKTWTGSDAPLRDGIGQVNILDLVMHTGREARWGGFGSREYKVQHHLQLVSLIWLKAGFPREGLAYVMVHDHHEAYTGDLPSPLKRLVGDDLKKLEAYLDVRIYEAFGLPQPDEATRRLVKLCDLAALVIEAPLFGPPGSTDGDVGNPSPSTKAFGVFSYPDVPMEYAVEVANLVRKVMPDFEKVIAARRTVGDR